MVGGSGLSPGGENDLGGENGVWGEMVLMTQLLGEHVISCQSP